MKLKSLNIRNIFNGFKNLLFKKQKPIYKERYIICQSCPKRNKAFCSICGCYIKAKVSVDYPIFNNKSLGGCPLNKW